MPLSWRIVLFVLLILVGFVGGGLAGARTVPPGAGLEAGATVLVWAAGGVAASILTGFLVVMRTPVRVQETALMIAAVLAAFALLWLSGRISLMSA